MKSLQTLLVIAFVILSLTGCQGGQPETETYKIGILQLVDALSEVEDGFRAGMAELGYTEGENVVYMRQNAQANMEDLARFAQEMVDEEVDVIVAITTPSAIKALEASEGTDIPVVFIMVSDPIRAGLVESFAAPGGRVTGIADGMNESAGKRLELLQKLAPDIQTVLSVYSDEESLLPAEENLRQAAKQLGLTLVEQQVSTSEEAAAAFQAIQPGEVDAIFVPADGTISDAHSDILALAIRERIPCIYGGSEEDALAAYGPNFFSSGSQAASLVDKVLRGVDPGTLPVEFVKKFDLVIDLNIAKQIDLTIPDDVLNIADTIIE